MNKPFVDFLASSEYPAQKFEQEFTEAQGQNYAGEADVPRDRTPLAHEGAVLERAASACVNGQSGEGLTALLSLTRDSMAKVNETVLSRTGSDVTMIPEVANHLISSGGKRLRPLLTLASAGLCGYQGEGHVKLAASVEFMHTATLLHDDVVDDSTLRRGKPAARVIWGNEASVLVGDFLLGQAFRMMVEVGSLPCLDVLSHAASVIAEGEVMQLSTAKHLSISDDWYMAVIKAKTAALFAAACEVGAILANCSAHEREACRIFGSCLGIAFQLVDDALDYGGLHGSRAPGYSGINISLGKNLGDDFREGKITLPVLLAYQRGTQQEQAFWHRTVEEGHMEPCDFDTARGYLIDRDGLLDTFSRARIFGDQAIAALSIFAPSPWRTALEEAVHFSITRAH